MLELWPMSWPLVRNFEFGRLEVAAFSSRVPATHPRGNIPAFGTLVAPWWPHAGTGMPGQYRSLRRLQVNGELNVPPPGRQRSARVKLSFFKDPETLSFCFLCEPGLEQQKAFKKFYSTMKNSPFLQLLFIVFLIQFFSCASPRDVGSVLATGSGLGSRFALLFT